MRSSYSDGGVQRSSPPRRGHAEESEIARMYDYATWIMYERIVSARRRRLALIDQQLRREEEEKEEEERRAGDAVVVVVVVAAADSSRVSSTAACPATWDAVVMLAPERDEPRAWRRPTPQAVLHKNSSNDDNSDDETERASTTSSWSRADSHLNPGHEQRQRGGAESATARSPGLPSPRRLGFPSSSKNDEGRHEMTTNGNNNEDDAFIFELEM
jgi:hypothetical protein